ncbi:hypothetical protein OG987_13265 [Streptomyces sp. NBC_01620]|uniref:hypothetical protein n=1 Tax=Streptomyces sp. NBC_01620 TaxID=2975902 RepID=UPI00386525CD|nr:hypothetical protein OG987_13265 [Streptomyces sp. NBC_01620]
MYPALFTTPGVRDFAEDIDQERQAQLKKFGEQRHPDGTGMHYQKALADQERRACQAAFENGRGTWRHILHEEVYEAFAEKDPDKLRTELLQVAAVCAAWISDIDQRPATSNP